MSDDTLNVQIRNTRGTREARRLRREGGVPAVLYGHGEETVSLRLSGDELEGALRHGVRVVNLQGEISDSALIRDVQWDTFGTHILHVDLTRVSASERIEITVAIELRGDAPGLKAGGVLERPVHEVEIECPAAQIVDKLIVSVNQLELDQSITAGELELPEGASLITDAEAVLVQCVEAKPDVDEDETAPESLEPEVIGAKDETEQEEN